MLLNSIINFLLGLKDLRDSGRNYTMAIITMGHSDSIKDNEMVVFYGIFEWF